MPTELLGSGATQAKLYAIVGPRGSASRRARLWLHVLERAARTSSASCRTRSATPPASTPGSIRRVTFTADFIGRTQIDADRLVLEEQTFESVSRTDATVQQTTRLTPTIVTGNLNVLLGSVGLKVNPVGRLLLVGNVLLALGEGGLQDEVTPVFGLEYSF